MILFGLDATLIIITHDRNTEGVLRPDLALTTDNTEECIGNPIVLINSPLIALDELLLLILVTSCCDVAFPVDTTV